MTPTLLGQEKRTFFLTFGAKYEIETHPYFAEASPHGWVTIRARNYEEARQIAFNRLGKYWCWIYESSSFDSSPYPLGELAVFEGDDD